MLSNKSNGTSVSHLTAAKKAGFPGAAATLANPRLENGIPSSSPVPPSSPEKVPARRILYPIHSLKAFILATIVSCVGLIWLLTLCLPAIQWDIVPTTRRTISLVKEAIQYSSATAVPPSGVLEVFQVHQPVLTSSGIVDETTLNDGSEDTTLIAQTAPTSSCETLLMEHSFGFSYGIPFVGKLTALTGYPAESLIYIPCR